MTDTIKNRVKAFLESILRPENNEQDSGGPDPEKIIVIVISLILAFSIWFIVNLNRDFNLDIEVPVELGNITTDLALAEELPELVTASVNGNGWDLITLYNDPPNIYIDVSKKEINLFEQVRQQMSNNSNVTVQTVDPLYLQIPLEPKESKNIPVKSNIEVNFAKQYSFLDELVLSPDSVTIRGASSHIAGIEEWPTDTIRFNGVNEDISGEINLKKPSSLITMSQTSVEYQGRVTQFTEGEATISVQTRNFPVGNMITFSPSSVQVKYRVPLNDYAKLQGGKPFEVYVEYTQIENDSTGFVSPQVEKILENANMHIRSIQPPEVAYFTVIGN